jgi:cytochrome c-type biogenesis protein CcmH
VITFFTFAACISALALGVMTWPLWRRAATPAPSDGTALAPLRDQLRQLQSLHDAGALGESAYQEARAVLERRVVDSLMTTPSNTAAGPDQANQRGLRLALSLSLGVVAVAVAGYAWQGKPQALDGPADAAMAAAPGRGNAHPLTSDQIESMIDKLAARLAAQPDDADGWTMLGRSYQALGKHQPAVDALRRALALRADDASLLADTADALAMAHGRKLDGEPAQMVVRALALEPDNVKALSLAGTIAFDRGDFTAALRHWERMQQVAPDSELTRNVQGGIDEARLRLGDAAPPLQAARAASAATPVASTTAAPAGTAVSGTVTLAGAVAGQARPDDTLFVFARAAEGPRMPLAILRKQVRDLPLTFTLGDAQAMSPDARLSSATRVVVGARVSRSGGATPQAGDLQGFSVAVAPGASQLKIEIAEVVR